jgi:hypothetical protein
VEGQAHGGAHALELRRDVYAAYKDAQMLRQAFDAAPWRGQEVRLRGWLRGDGSAAARMMVSVKHADFLNAFYDDGSRTIAKGDTWSEREIRAFVPADASAIEIGLALEGKGSGWFDDLSLEVAPPR